MTLTLPAAISRYGAEAKAKLSNPAATGEPEDQLRAPLETLFADLTELCGRPRWERVESRLCGTPLPVLGRQVDRTIRLPGRLGAGRLARPGHTTAQEEWQATVDVKILGG